MNRDKFFSVEVRNELDQVYSDLKNIEMQGILHVGEILSKFKELEGAVDILIARYIDPKNTGFFHSVLLKSDIMSFGNKISIIQSICQLEEVDIQLNSFYELAKIRNLLAHETFNRMEEPYETLGLMERIKRDKKSFGYSHRMKMIGILKEEFYENALVVNSLLKQISASF